MAPKLAHRLLIAMTTLALVDAAVHAAEPTSAPATAPATGTIAFASLAPRGWDLHVTDVNTGKSRRLTSHAALDYNAAFSADGEQLAFVSERDGNMELFASRSDGSALRRLTDNFALDDHPTWSPDGRQIAFVSTRRPVADVPGRAWNAIYIMNADGSSVKRISERGAADYSPAWSPEGDLIALASGSGAAGGSDVLVMKPDGGGRRVVVKDGGWPVFTADGAGLCFHSRRDGSWGIWRGRLDGSGLERVTPRNVEAYTPSTSADGKWLVVAVRRGEHRQIERIELPTGKMTAVTDDPTDHWNPCVSPDGRHVVYHKIAPDSATPDVEPWGAPSESGLRVFRVAGAFPAFSPDGKHLALTGGNFSRLDVMNIDGAARRTLYDGERRSIFGISWARTGDRIAFSHGGTFQGPGAKVDVATVRPDGSDYRRLTDEAGNNGFPSFSPDGRQLVFRSGRDSSKNLYVTNADGTGTRRLTQGKWTDTMCDWSPTGEWIVFASDRDGDFEIWLIKPDGAALHKLVAGGERNNHPRFSPDGQWVVFTSKRAGHSAEEISLPHQPQPYGDLFAMRIDGTSLLRLTHNGFEEGTPAWGRLSE